MTNSPSTSENTNSVHEPSANKTSIEMEDHKRNKTSLHCTHNPVEQVSGPSQNPIFSSPNPGFDSFQRLDSTNSNSVKVVHRMEFPRRYGIIDRLDGNLRMGTLEYFFNHVLPPIGPEVDINLVYKSCIKRKILTKYGRSRRYTWKGLRKNSKVVSDHANKNVFMNILRAVTEVVRKSSTSSIVISSLFTTVDGDQGLGGDIEQDAVVYLENACDTPPDSSEERRWYNSSFSFHFKTSKNDAYDNIQSILQRLVETICRDPCRRFALGATIEGTSMRLWIYNKAMIVASEQFDVNSDAKTLIRLITSLAVANRADLGWDTTINPKFDKNGRLFDIKIHEELYKTSSSDIVFQHDEKKIYSSGTRIYKAVRANDIEKKEYLIIKDYWPVDFCDTEDIKQKKILDDISDPLEREVVGRSMFTPIAGERVKMGDHEDHTKGIILRGGSPNGAYRVTLPDDDGVKGTFLLCGPNSWIDIVEEPHPDTLEELRNAEKCSYTHRWHYRIVYKEVAIPYYNLRNLKDMALVLEHTVEALRVIHKAGWVHRDLSVGNLYLYIDPVSGEKRGIIGDFEFAKKVGTGGRREMKIGTPNFTATEIAAQLYQYRVPIFEKTSVEEILKVLKRKVPSELLDKVGFWTNYLHDLESIWWIMIWTVVHFQKAVDFESNSSAYKSERKRKIKVANKLFSNPTIHQELEERRLFFSTFETYYRYTRSIPNTFPELLHIVEFFKNQLLSNYFNIEKDLDLTTPILLSDADEGLLHNELLGTLRSSLCEDVNIVPIWTRPINRNSDRTEPNPIQEVGDRAENHESQPNGSRVLNESNLDVAARHMSSCKANKPTRKRKAPTQDITGGPSRPVTRSRMSRPDENRRITRSMAKALSKETTLGEVRDASLPTNHRSSRRKPLDRTLQKKCC